MTGRRKVKISAKSARLRFHGCTPEYIKDVCKGRCCESSTAPTGTMITVHPSEQASIEARGGVVKGGLLQPKPGTKKCPFKEAGTNLCGIHFTPDKMFGCIASPFTLNKNDTLIVRNRYRLLICYNKGPQLPAYVAFRASLDKIFGLEEAARICAHLAAGGGDLTAWVDEGRYKMLTENDEIKRASKATAIPGNGSLKGPGNGSMIPYASSGPAKNMNTAAWVQEKGLEGLAAGGDPGVASGTSIFDPVLCELAYRWFCPPAGLVLDPFAGGSVRGIVAAKLGREYIGHELRLEQVEANRAQAEKICESGVMPAWICGDSRTIDQTCSDVDADFIFSCPPYADLEVYSDDPQDLSTLGYSEFRDAYFEIIAKACARLKPDRFACFVVGEVRGKDGNYLDFVGDTVQAFRDAGLGYYNEAILVTSVGSLPIRAGRQFAASRKLGKTHQNILVFVKGSGKKAVEACGVVDVSDALALVDPGTEPAEGEPSSAQADEVGGEI